MNRRQVLASTGLALSPAVAGCLASSVEPKEHPEFPDSFTRGDVVDFVEAYETAEFHNSLADTDADDVSVNCFATADRTVDSSIYGLVTCFGDTRTEPLLGTPSVSEYATDPIAYRVDERDAQRVELESIERGGDRLLAFNFGDADRELAVTISPREASADGPKLDDEYTLAAGTGLQRPISDVSEDGYEVTVESDGESAEPFAWDAPDEPLEVVIYVTPSGAVDVGALPDELR